MKYKLTIVSTDEKRETNVYGDSVNDCIEKLQSYHHFGEFERDFFTRKGGQRLNQELESGWYINL